MAPPSLLVLLSLALSVHSRPRLRYDAQDLPVVAPSARSLPVTDSDISMGTLPVPPGSKRTLAGSRPSERRHDAPFGALYDDVRRSLPADEGSSGILTLPVIHAEFPGLDRRAVEMRLENRSDVAYYAQLSIGNPPQKVFAQLDTGSFELWVNPDCKGLPIADQGFCQAIGRYDPASSSTSVVSQVGTSLRYGIGAANITYVADDIALSSSASMKKVQFGVATSSEDQFSGILGIGYGKGFNIGYNNFIDELAAQGVTKTKSFSVALGSKEEKQGVVVFGGVDTSKFTGTLATLPIIPASQSPDRVARYWATLKSITHTGQGGNSASLAGKAMPVFLDTGATLTLLPPDVTKAMATALNATGMDLNGFYTVDCGLAKMNGTIDFAFEGVTIRVPYKEIIREMKAKSPMCYLGVMQSNMFALLGDTFLRSAYVVFDLSANMTYMAPYTNCGSSPKSINASSDLKGLSGTCNAQNGAKAVGAADVETTGGKASAAASLRGEMAWLGAAAGVMTCAFSSGIL
ncbi:Candidapepsin-2 [Tolypocladium ophioglossoides CBS 100239]|uniref:Candidapepsin-2 n=1 Tax=Tolypocladium ophioglossoides (strain CBS 100239) TaxID=1163406 RepID=A0A0L0NAP4_TOLOC|nr:Candidapepsin-2 [Tolypocladium ophioglossoides CBS 100239]